MKVYCCLHNVIRAAPAERRARQDVAVKLDWRLVEEEELHMIYGDDFVDDARTSSAVARGLVAVPSADMSVLRRKRVEHFNLIALQRSPRAGRCTRDRARSGGRVRAIDVCSALFL